MVLRGLALITCEFSGEAFDTADVVRPRWSDVPTHAASMATLTAIGAILGFGLLGIRWAIRRVTPLSRSQSRAA
jgi:hypothetical protein